MKKITLSLLLMMSLGVSAQPLVPITLEDIFEKGLFNPKNANGMYHFNDGNSYATIKTDPQSQKSFCVKIGYLEGKENLLFRQIDLIHQGDTLIPTTCFSNDEKKVLLSNKVEKIYRHSAKANYYVYNLESKTIVPVSENGKQQYATFSPDGSKIAFVRDNNLFIKDLNSNIEFRITTDGELNKIINGRGDWVYEEEFGLTKAFEWSADSKHIAYLKFDESEVNEHHLDFYSEDESNKEALYKYPLSGTKNATVTVWVYHLYSKENIQITLPEEEGEYYLPHIRWTEMPNVLCIQRLNRLQNKLDYILANTVKNTSAAVITEEEPQYADICKEIYFLKSQKEFIISSERDGYRHLYLYKIDGSLSSQLTKGEWDVTKIIGIEEPKKTVYFQSTQQGAIFRDVYSVDFGGKFIKKLNSVLGDCDWSFNKNFNFYIQRYSSIQTPTFISLHKKDGSLIRVLEDNKIVLENSKKYQYRTLSFSELSAKGKDSTAFFGYTIKPYNFNNEKKYPLLIYTYGGPGAQSVINQWQAGRNVWLQYIANQGYIVVCFDNRGTGGRGAEFKKSTYKRLGVMETEDQIAIAKWYRKQPYIDSTRIGIYGWSFGGYVSTRALLSSKKIFKAGIAVAPVTDWRFYDSAYTERYMQSPKLNPAGYQQTSLLPLAERLESNFLLIHGTADDNVHFRHSAILSSYLIKHNKAFEQGYYPNSNHSINGGKTSLHLYRKMTDFILDKL